MPRNPAKHSARPSRQKNRCQHLTSNGLRCRMLRAPDHSAFCVLHAQQNQDFINADEVAAELRNADGHFQTALSINKALGKLFQLVASGRIPPREATALAYIAQALLLTLRYLPANGLSPEQQTKNDEGLKKLYALVLAAKAHPSQGGEPATEKVQAEQSKLQRYYTHLIQQQSSEDGGN